MHNTAIQSQFIAEHELDFGTFRCYKNLVIGTVHEGVKITLDKALPVLALGVEYYNDKNPVVYLSDRRHSYSIDPTMHLEIRQMFPYLIGYGVVAYNDLNFRVAQLEQRFLPCPTGVFHDLPAAVEWAQSIIASGRTPCY